MGRISTARNAMAGRNARRTARGRLWGTLEPHLSGRRGSATLVAMTYLRPLGAAIVLIAVAGCHLVDQRDFDRNAGRKPQPPAGKFVAVAGPAPLLTITYTTDDPPYADELAVAVKRALALKPDVLFTIQALVPLAPSPELQAAALRVAAASGHDVSEAIIADGADKGQIELAVRGDPSVHVQKIQVFVH